MKKTMSIAAITLMMAGSSAFACGSCGCKADKGEKSKSECSAGDEGKACKGADAKSSAAKK
jgi:hypothetical protein